MRFGLRRWVYGRRHRPEDLLPRGLVLAGECNSRRFVMDTNWCTVYKCSILLLYIIPYIHNYNLNNTYTVDVSFLLKYNLHIFDPPFVTGLWRLGPGCQWHHLHPGAVSTLEGGRSRGHIDDLMVLVWFLLLKLVGFWFWKNDNQLKFGQMSNLNLGSHFWSECLGEEIWSSRVDFRTCWETSCEMKSWNFWTVTTVIVMGNWTLKRRLAGNSLGCVQWRRQVYMIVYVLSSWRNWWCCYFVFTSP